MRITRVFDEEDVNQDIGDFLDGPVDTPYRTHNSSQVWSSDESEVLDILNETNTSGSLKYSTPELRKFGD